MNRRARIIHRARKVTRLSLAADRYAAAGRSDLALAYVRASLRARRVVTR